MVQAQSLATAKNNMRPIPLKLREQLASTGEMKLCIYNNADCKGRVEWEHAWDYGGKQIQEAWAIIPCCTYHHRGAGLDKDFNHFMSLLKARELASSGVDVFYKYPKKNWPQLWQFLSKKYETYLPKV